MGQTLSEPITSKNTSFCQNSKYQVASSSMQGWRITMEDAHTHILSLPDDPDAAFFAVFDGHGGAKVSEFAGKHLHKYVTSRKEYADGNIEEALKQAYLQIDEDMVNDDRLCGDQSGSTAVVVLIKDDVLYCANVGDSRAVASVGGLVKSLSIDHKPNRADEYKRIHSAGGFVDFNRVNGNLALSRALGDYIFKQNKSKGPKEQIVTAYPEVNVFTITPDWEFIVLACDGIWDVMTSGEVVSYVREQISIKVELEDICENLMTMCLAPDCQMGGLGCDNMTVIVVGLLKGKSFEELCQKCSEPKKSLEELDDELVPPF